MATVLNPGDVGRGIDKSVTPANSLGAFRPNGEFAVIAATSSAGSVVQLPRSLSRADDCVRIINTGATPVRFRFGGASSVATAADKGVAAGATEVFRCNPGTTHIALFSSAAGSVEIDMGVGT